MGLEDIRKKALELAKKKVSELYSERDRYVIQAMNAVDDLDGIYNLMVARIREWYGLHFPEINQLVRDHREFLEIVAKIGKREAMTESALEEIVKKDRARKIVEVAGSSMGTDISDEDIEKIREYAEIALDVRDYRERLVEYVEEEMRKIAPNLSAIAGPILGARLLAKAGGLKKLALLPASTIQVIGAEKALFRHLRTGARPPKHGILFQHPLVRTAKKWQRGKIARTLAAKLAIAAKEDYFGGKYIADELRKEIEERVKEIKEKYPNPPKRQGKRKRKR